MICTRVWSLLEARTNVTGKVEGKNDINISKNKSGSVFLDKLLN